MEINFQKKSNLLFIEIAALGAILTAICVIVFYNISNFIFTTIGTAVIQKAEVACGCQVASATTNYTLVGLVSLLGLAIITILLLATLKTIISIVKTNRFLHKQKINI